MADVERTVSVVAIEHSEILMLYRSDFWLALKEYPVYLAHIKNVVQSRAEYTI